MFGQAANIVIPAHFNKYRQAWALVILLQTRWWFLFFLFFLSNLAISLGFKAVSGNRCVNAIELSCYIRVFYGFVLVVCQKTLQARGLSALHGEKLA